jgi:hypothetical protein
VIANLLSKAPEQRPSCEQLFEMEWVRDTVTKFSTKVVQARREQMEKMVVLQAKAHGMDPRRALRKVRRGRIAGGVRTQRKPSTSKPDDSWGGSVRWGGRGERQMAAERRNMEQRGDYAGGQGAVASEPPEPRRPANEGAAEDDGLDHAIGDQRQKLLNIQRRANPNPNRRRRASPTGRHTRARGR